MSLAIQFGDSTDQTSLSGAIYFDVVTQYTKNHSGKVTEHPIEAGASVTDHFISKNPTFNISGVISHIDFSPISSLLSFGELGEPVMNNNTATTPVIINDMGSGLSRLIPGVVGQFLQKKRPDVFVDPSEKFNYKLSVENFFEVLMSGLFYNEARKRWENRMTPCILYELNGATPVKPIPDLICTSFQAREDENSGDALFIDLSFEQVRFVTLEKVEAPKPQPKTPVARATAEKANKGSKPGVVNDPTNPPKQRESVTDQLQKGNEALGSL